MEIVGVLMNILCCCAPHQKTKHVALEDGAVVEDTSKTLKRKADTSTMQSTETLRVERKIAMLKALHEKKGTAYKVRFWANLLLQIVVVCT